MLFDYGNESFMDGSSYYMSPDQVDSLPIDNRTDIYGRGITAHEMVTGEKPFVSGDHWKIMQIWDKLYIPDPGNIVPKLPEILRKFILIACSRDPAESYQDLNQLLEDLQPLAGEYGYTQMNRKSEKCKMSCSRLSSI